MAELILSIVFFVMAVALIYYFLTQAIRDYLDAKQEWMRVQHDFDAHQAHMDKWYEELRVWLDEVERDPKAPRPPAPRYKVGLADDPR